MNASSSSTGRGRKRPPDDAHIRGVETGTLPMTASSSSTGGTRKRPHDDSRIRGVVVEGFLKKSGLDKRIAEGLERGVVKVVCPQGEPLSEGSEAYKAYKNQYKRLCTHLRRNGALARRLAGGELKAEQVAGLSDEALMADAQRSEREQFRHEGLQEALGIIAEDTAHWTPSDNFNCPTCESARCIYISTFRGSHGYDDNNQEPAITIRCTECKHLWKEDEVEGGRLAAGSFKIDGQAASNVDTTERNKAVGSKDPVEKPAIWHEDADRRPPTWLLPA